MKPEAVKGQWLSLPAEHGGQKMVNRYVLERACTYEYSNGARVCEAVLVGDSWALPRETMSDSTLQKIGFDVIRVVPEYPKAFESATNTISPERAKTERMTRIQHLACDSLSESHGGVIQLPPGTGKTAIALRMAQIWAVPTLVVVHTKDLQRQWIKEAQELLGLPEERVGIIGGGSKTWTWENKDIVVATVQSLISKIETLPLLAGHFGLAIYDEVHHMQGLKFREALPVSRRYRIGLSATVEMDGLEQVFLNHLGPIVYRSEETDLTPTVRIVCVNANLDSEALRRIDRPTFTDIDKILDRIHADAEDHGVSVDEIIAEGQAHAIASRIVQNSRISRTLNEVAGSQDLCQAIIQRVRLHSAEGRAQLILSDRISQLVQLHNMLEEESLLVTSSTETRIRDLARTTGKTVFATTGTWIEGLSRDDFSVLHIGLPWSGKRRFIQGTGRILRSAENKPDPIVYCYKPVDVPMLARMSDRFRSHCRRYRYPTKTERA
jgi:superfamily II DNA or RNA helicase